MKKLICFLLSAMLILSFTACSKGDNKDTGKDPAAQQTTEPSSPSEATEATEPVQTNASVLEYYNDVAYFFYSGIETHYNNRFDEAEFVCVVNMADGSWDITDGEKPGEFANLISDVIRDIQAKEFKSGPKATGTVLVKYQYGQLHYVQYKEADNGSVIGQYADPAKVADGHIQWGVFHNRTRCDACANS